jgi:hypothetical protein
MGSESHYTSPNTSGIKRGDGEETGDLEARPTASVDKAGSGKHKSKPDAGPEGVITADPSALGTPRGNTAGTTLEPDSVLEELTVKDAMDPSLGLTNVPGHPPEDPIADENERTITKKDAEEG